MAPEHDARTRAFYDHESDEPAPARRRRAAADWGVNEDIFDRMPSRRFKRTDRRAEHRDDAGPRFERRTSGPSAPRADEWADGGSRYDDWSDAHEHHQVAPRHGDWEDTAESRRAAEWQHDEPRRDDRSRAGGWTTQPRATTPVPAPASGNTTSPPRRPSPRRRVGRPRRPRPRARAARRAGSHGAPPAPSAESWTAGDEGNVEIEGKRPIQSWLEPERGESRTIVLERSEPADSPR